MTDGIAAVLSFLIPGLGQIIKGHILRGLVVFFFTTMFMVIFFPIGILFWIVNILDAQSLK